MTTDPDPRTITRFDPNTPANRRFREAMNAGIGTDPTSCRAEQLTGLLQVAAEDAWRRADHGNNDIMQAVCYLLRQLAEANTAVGAGSASTISVVQPPQEILDRVIAAADEVYTEYLRETRGIPMLTVVPWDAARHVLRELREAPAANALIYVARRLPTN